MKKLLLLLSLGLIAASAILLPRRLTAELPVPPSKPKHWTITIPHWQPTREDSRLTKQERYFAREDDRRVISAACDEAGLPHSTEPRAVDLTVLLRKGQHRPPAEAIWPAIEDALGMCGRVGQVVRGSVKFERHKGQEVGTTIRVREVR